MGSRRQIQSSHQDALGQHQANENYYTTSLHNLREASFEAQGVQKVQQKESAAPAKQMQTIVHSV